jgi:hypothetical protein
MVPGGRFRPENDRSCLGQTIQEKKNVEMGLWICGHVFILDME